MQKIYYIQQKDLNKFNTVIQCPCCNSKEVINFSDVLGKVLPCDIGKKMVKHEKGFWQVENDGQFQKRIK